MYTDLRDNQSAIEKREKIAKKRRGEKEQKKVEKDEGSTRIQKRS